MIAKPAKVDFRIKLLSGNNVVMVEAGGFESEIFVPLIINGRIGFQNIIPNRRCCTSSPSNFHGKNSNAKCFQHFTPTHMKSRQYTPPSNIPTSTRLPRMSAGQEMRLAPLAYSTPATTTSSVVTPTVMQSPKGASRRMQQRRSHLSISRSFSNTPEMPRREAQSIYDVAKDTLVQIPSGIKVIRLYRNPTPTIPQTKNVLRVVGTNTESQMHRCRSVDLLQPPPPSPIPTQTEKAYRPLNEVEVSQFRLPETPDLKARSKRKQNTTNSPASATKWRKCITPIRTYSKRQGMQRHGSAINVNKKAFNNSAARARNRAMPTVRLGGKVLPSYMINPTQTAKCAVQVEVKKRKVIIDPKLTITPRTFKKQQRDTSDLKNNSKYRLPTNRKEYEASKLSAFEMLTNSNRVRNMSLKLNGQFRKCCINKASSTNPKYKQLCSIPPLQQDHQTREVNPNSENAAIHRSIQSQTHRNQNMVATTRLKIPELISIK